VDGFLSILNGPANSKALDEPDDPDYHDNYRFFVLALRE
jgi:hypothetical protein